MLNNRVKPKSQVVQTSLTVHSEQLDVEQVWQVPFGQKRQALLTRLKSVLQVKQLVFIGPVQFRQEGSQSRHRKVVDYWNWFASHNTQTVPLIPKPKLQERHSPEVLLHVRHERSHVWHKLSPKE